jgi:transcriptional regulator with PAS, ATPase and Fis domain
LPGEQTFSAIIGESKAIRQICSVIGKFAKTDYTVLIQGDTGVGKERVAEAIHAHSKVSEGPLVRVNCAALPDSLIESELFGHIKGAFTGASISHKGLFETAQNGSILLDEIGAMSLLGQAKLLRVLQEKEFHPVGSSTTIRTNARVIATTNTPLEKAIADGSFRADLYHRLNMVPIHIPPLCERKEDIPLMIYYFMKEFCAETNKDIHGFTRSVFEDIMDFDWPGNVRQLKNFVRYCILNEDTQIVQPESRPYSAHKETAGEHSENKALLFDGVSLKTSLRLMEGQIICQVLSLVKGQKSEAAGILKIHRKNLSYFLKKHDLGEWGLRNRKESFNAGFIEKRRAERRALSVPISLHFSGGRVSAPSDGKWIVFTEDISSRGLRFGIPFPPPGHIVHLSLRVPHFEKVEGRICWSRKKELSRYMIGAEIPGGYDLAQSLREPPDSHPLSR